MTTLHTRKTFFAKALAGLAGLGLVGAARAVAKPAASRSAPSSEPVSSTAPFVFRVDSRSVSRPGDSR